MCWHGRAVFATIQCCFNIPSYLWSSFISAFAFHGEFYHYEPEDSYIPSLRKKLSVGIVWGRSGSLMPQRHFLNLPFRVIASCMLLEANMNEIAHRILGELYNEYVWKWLSTGVAAAAYGWMCWHGRAVFATIQCCHPTLKQLHLCPCLPWRILPLWTRR